MEAHSMSNVGKTLRLKRIFREDGKTLIVALDHGIGAHPVPGLERPLDTILKVARGGADAILINLGTAKRFCEQLPRDLGLILSIQPDVRFVRIAGELGFHAVKNTFFGSLSDKRLRLLYPLGVECETLGVPFLAEIVPMDVEKRRLLYEPEQIKVAARMAAEFGADVIKTSYTGDVETFAEVVGYCPIPVVILGGSKMDSDTAVLETVKGAIDAGAAGVAFGRNIFQHRDPTAITQAIAKIIHEGAEVEDALSQLGTTARSMKDSG